MTNGKIVVIGSSNTDMVVQSGHLPVPGETVLGGEFMMNPGGKGANQAVAAAKLDGNIVFIAKVGDDVFGQQAIKGFQSHGINTDYVGIDTESASGVALIMVDEYGENCISVALGANAAMQNSDIDEAVELIRQADFVLLQLEVPLGVVEYATELANNAGVQVVLNPAPAQPLADKLLSMLYMITPNETEAELLTGITVTNEDTARDAATILRAKGVDTVVITMGSQGAYVLSKTEDQMISGVTVKAIDTTAAGDTFNGALVTGLAEGMSLLEAIIFANKAAAYSVTKSGAQISAPLRCDILNN